MRDWWQTVPSPRTGNPVYATPAVIVLYRKDQAWPLAPVIPRQGDQDYWYDLVIAAQPFRAKQSAETKVKQVLAPLSRHLAPEGSMVVMQSLGKTRVWKSSVPSGPTRSRFRRRAICCCKPYMRSSQRTMTGARPQEIVRELQAADADVVGANCGTGIDDMVELGRQIREATDGYTLIHSNAGIPSIKDAEIVYPESPDYMAPRFKALADMSITIIGGCCGTGPDHIRALTQALRG